MLSALLVCVASLAAEPAAPAASESQKASDLAAYAKARAAVGRDADAQVRLALWSEAHGLQTERLKHLALAILNDPAHAKARALMGLVAFGGQWRSPEAIRDQLAADETSQRALAEYAARRSRMRNSADAHWQMAVWCEQNGLGPEAAAHLTLVTQLDPGREAAWKRLGYKKQGRRWVTDEQLAAEKVDADVRRAIDKRWTMRLLRWRNGLEDKSSQPTAAKHLAGVADPQAVRAVWAVFASGDESLQLVAVQILGQIDAPVSTEGLARLAIASESAKVRGRAIETLRRRDRREVASFLMTLLRESELDPDPILYHWYLYPIGWDDIGSPGLLQVRGPHADFVRTYTVDEVATFLTGIERPWANGESYISRVMTQRQRQVSDLAEIVGRIQSESVTDIAAAKLLTEFKARIISVLSIVNGHNLGKDVEAWRKWWTEEQGYAYERQPRRQRQDWTQLFPKQTYTDYVHVHYSCFAAGTPVHTQSGLRPIESVQLGDRVLAADTKTGALGYQPVLAALHNKPALVLKIGFEGKEIKATPIHRFWKVGEGWVMARDLKPGDHVRALGEVAVVKTVQSDRVEPVFNLTVMQSHSFFVGDRGLLVHDSSPVQSVVQPFDAVPDLAAVSERPAKSR
jgi:hypothetical protein